MVLMPHDGFPNPVELEDPAKTGQRQEIGPTAHGVYLMAAARKTSSAQRHIDPVYQSDYSAQWTDAAVDHAVMI